MTVYALRLENATDTAGRVRMGDLLGLAPNGNLGARGGIRPGPTAADVAVTAGTMNVTVQPFLAWVDGGVGDTQGGYPFVSDAVVTLTLANGHGSLPRTDVIAAVVRDDPYDSSGTVAASVEVIAGTPGAGTPTLPTNSVPLRNIVVPAGASTGTGGLSSGALSTDRRTYTTGLGGIVPVASQAERDALPNIVPTVAFRTDTGHLEVRRSSGWQRLDSPQDAWSAYSSGTVMTTDGGPPNLGVGGGAKARYTEHGKTVHWRIEVYAADSGINPGTGHYYFPLPTAVNTDAYRFNVGTISIVDAGELVAFGAVEVVDAAAGTAKARVVGTTGPVRHDIWGLLNARGLYLHGTYEKP